jgi:hypothetical protein
MASKLVSRAVTATVLMAAGLGMGRAEPVSVPWNKVCAVAGRRELSITTQGGETVQGVCLAINVDEMAVTTEDRRVVKIARSALARIRVHRRSTNGHELAALGRGMHEGLRIGFGWLFSPAAELGIAVVPGTLAWGAIALPFCIAGDLHYRISGTEEIKVL